MDDEAAQAIRAELDQVLKTAGPNVGIAFGTELFNEFRKRDWFTLETFGVLGTMFMAMKVPAYQRSHYVFPTWDLPDYEFKVGKEGS